MAEDVARGSSPAIKIDKRALTTRPHKLSPAVSFPFIEPLSDCYSGADAISRPEGDPTPIFPIAFSPSPIVFCLFTPGGDVFIRDELAWVRSLTSSIQSSPCNCSIITLG